MEVKLPQIHLPSLLLSLLLLINLCLYPFIFIVYIMQHLQQIQLEMYTLIISPITQIVIGGITKVYILSETQQG